MAALTKGQLLDEVDLLYPGVIVQDCAKCGCLVTPSAPIAMRFAKDGMRQRGGTIGGRPYCDPCLMDAPRTVGKTPWTLGQRSKRAAP
jgi:hypothetical protein